MNQRKRIYVDMDGVIADLNSEWIRRYNYKYKCNETVELFSCWDVHTLVPCGVDIYNFLDEEDFFSSLPVIEKSQEILQKLNEYYDIYIATAAYNPMNIIPKFHWLQKHFPFIDRKKYVFAVDKSVLHGDCLIDDKPENLEGFTGRKILFSAPHNKTEKRFIRADNWDEVWEYFEGGM